MPLTAVTPSDDKPILRYDGKTFDQWRTAWQTELSTEKRLEAVKALAAFGANGYGKEAAQAIAEVAGQYNWTLLGNDDAVDALKKACLSAFTGRDWRGSKLTHELPTEDAVPVLLSLAASENVQSRLFATWALGYTQLRAPDDARIPEALLKLSSDSDPTIRAYAVGYLDGSPEAQDRIRRSLGDADAKVQTAAVQKLIVRPNPRGGGMMGRDRTRYLPELFPLLFAEDESLRRAVRVALKNAERSVIREIVGQLNDVLNDESRRTDHLEAIRALIVLGKQSKPAADTLKTFLSSEDDETRVAAAAALKTILSQDDYDAALADKLGEELGLTIDPKNGAAIQEDGMYHEFERQVLEEMNSHLY
jgi:HEAT repeat protein